MLRLGVQTNYVIEDNCPQDGFAILKRTGFSCADFSLNGYLKNTDIYKSQINHFFSRSTQELEAFFRPHKLGAAQEGIAINQMHMPYPIYVPGADGELNDYLREVVASKSIALCSFFQCPYIVMHGYKVARYLGSESREWEQTERFLDTILPMAKEMGITICIENLYDSVGGHLIEGPCCNANKAAERIDRINDKYHAEVLGFCFDTGHANLIGVDFENFITILGHRLKVLHIHDNDGKQDLHQIPFTFTATRENKSSTDWEGFIRGLRNIHFDAVLSFETAPVLSAFPEEMEETVLGFIAQIGKYFMEQISG
jgi:sugar phosphate isomerase/epimerase